MMNDIGILGTGLWNGPAVTNDHFAASTAAPVKDPFKGKRMDDGTVCIAGLQLTPERHGRALAAIERSYMDPFRGARRRRFFPAAMSVCDAETEAARAALADSSLTSGDIDGVFVQSLLPDEMLIKDATTVAHNLGITQALALNVESVCTSALSQAHLAASMIKAAQARNILCVQSVAYSRVVDKTSSLGLMVGDMASAFVIGRRPGARLGFGWRSDGRLHHAIRYQWVNPNPPESRRYWDRSDERLSLYFDNELQAEAMGELEGYAIPSCRDALGRAELALSEVDVFIPHQPLSWFPSLMDDMLGLRDGVTFHTFEEYASINACSVVASIHEARRSGRIKQGTRMLSFIPGGGYVYGAMAMVW